MPEVEEVIVWEQEDQAASETMLDLIPIKNINRVEFKMLDLMKLFKLDQDKEPEVRNLCFHSNLIKAELPRYMQSQIANILAFLENLQL